MKIEGTFGQRLKRVLELFEITQLRFAKDIGVKKDTVSSWCRDKSKPQLDALKLIIDYFGNKKDACGNEFNLEMLFDWDIIKDHNKALQPSKNGSKSTTSTSEMIEALLVPSPKEDLWTAIKRVQQKHPEYSEFDILEHYIMSNIKVE